MRFCTRCGKPLEDGARFCTSCGSPVEASTAAAPADTLRVSPPAAAAPATAPEYPPAAPPSDAPLPRESNGLPGPLIVIGIILVILIGLGIGATLYIRRQATTGGVTALPPVPADSGTYLRNLNLGTYPGAKPATVTTDSNENVISAFQTRDTPQQVIGYYKVRFPVADTNGEGSKSELRAALPSGEHVVIRAMQQESGTLVYIIREP